LDLPLARADFQSACDAGEPRGCGELGCLLVEAGDVELGARLHRSACERGVMRSCSHIGFLLEHGQGVARDEAAAAGMYGLACDGDDPLGCANLAVSYENGMGVPQRTPRALLSRACDADWPAACRALDEAQRAQ